MWILWPSRYSIYLRPGHVEIQSEEASKCLKTENACFSICIFETAPPNTHFQDWPQFNLLSLPILQLLESILCILGHIYRLNIIQLFCGHYPYHLIELNRSSMRANFISLKHASSARIPDVSTDFISAVSYSAASTVLIK